MSVTYFRNVNTYPDKTVTYNSSQFSYDRFNKRYYAEASSIQGEQSERFEFPRQFNMKSKRTGCIATFTIHSKTTNNDNDLLYVDYIATPKSIQEFSGLQGVICSIMND